MRCALLFALVCLLPGLDLADPAWLDRLRPVLTAEGQADLARVPHAARWEIDAELVAEPPAVRGSLRLRWVNPGPDPVPDLVLNCWPNSRLFVGASLTLSELRLDGAPCESVAEQDGEIQRLVLPRPLPPGGALTLEGRFTANLGAAGYHGLMTRRDGTWVLSAFVPEVGVRVAGAWRSDPLGGMADALRTHTAHWLLRLRVPGAAAVAGPGGELARRELPDGRHEVEIAAPLARNLCVVVAEDGLATVERTVGDVTVRMWHRPEVRPAASRAADACAAALRRCATAFGPYPWREFDAVEAPLDGGVGGVEASGLVLVGRDLCDAVGDLDPALPPQGLAARMLTEASMHETCHQWWHLMVGSDTVLHPWLDESLTNWAGGWVLEQEHGPTLGGAVWSMSVFGAQMVREPWAMTLPACAYTETAYGAVVYMRGALMYQRLRGALGEAKFLAALRDWTERHRFAWAEPADWQDWLDRHAPAELAAEIRTRWLTGTDLGQADYVRAMLARP